MGPIGLISVSRSVVSSFLFSPSPAPVPTGVSEDGEWRIPAKDYASTRFSGLDEINVGNMAQLQPAEQKGDKKTTRRSHEGGEGGTEQ